MKKYAILTSVLALTACATGGGSGGGSSSTARPAFDGGDLAKFIACKGDECIKITSSETDQAKYAKKLSRAAITRQSITVNGEDGWEIHNMGDIPMNSLFGPNNPGKMKFNVNSDGDIEGLQFYEIQEWDNLPDRFKDPMTYIGSETFSLNSDTTSGSAHMNIDEAKNQGLQFSTFGTLEVRDFVWTGHDVGDGNMDIPFAGGYDAAKQDPSVLAQSESKEYTGVASGMIEYAGTAVGKDQDYLNIRADDAKLVISTSGGDLTETLTASFKETDNQTKNWHDVTAIKYKEGDEVKIKFTFEGTPDNQKFSMRGANDAGANIFNANYYGSNKNIAEEATGLFQYQERIDPAVHQISDNNKTMYFGFGGKVQEQKH